MRKTNGRHPHGASRPKPVPLLDEEITSNRRSRSAKQGREIELLSAKRELLDIAPNQIVNAGVKRGHYSGVKPGQWC